MRGLRQQEYRHHHRIQPGGRVSLRRSRIEGEKMTDKSREAIDGLTKDEIREEIAKGPRSRFQRDTAAYLHVRLAQIEDQERAAQQADEARRHEREIETAEEANRIASGANRLSKLALGISVVAVFVSLISSCST